MLKISLVARIVLIKIYCPCVKKIPTLGYRIHSTSHIYSTVFTYNTATSCVFLDSAGRCRRLPDLPPSADFQHYIYPYPPGYSAVLFSDASLVTSPIFPSTPSLRARKHFPSGKILRMCIYGTPYSILGAPDDYMEYRKYTFLEFSQWENASCPQCLCL